jgi:YD repeat-containing protein
VTQIVDSINGTITRVYDGLDRLTSETTPQGSVSYTYDNASRRSTMTVAGQSVVNYTHDNTNRLTQITQGAATVTIGYDTANRRTSVTLPNGVAVAYGYDAASRVTSIAYTQGQTTIGNLTYTYDAKRSADEYGGKPGARESARGSLVNDLQCEQSAHQLEWHDAEL